MLPACVGTTIRLLPTAGVWDQHVAGRKMAVSLFQSATRGPTYLVQKKEKWTFRKILKHFKAADGPNRWVRTWGSMWRYPREFWGLTIRLCIILTVFSSFQWLFSPLVFLTGFRKNAIMKQISFPTLRLLKIRGKNSSFVQIFGSFEA